MLQFMFSCAALLAGASPNAVGADGTDDWSRLDAELAHLAANAPVDATGPQVSGYLRTFYAFQKDAPAIAGHPDVSGFFIDRVRLQIDGGDAKYTYRLKTEAADGTVRLLDAYGAFKCTDYLRTTFGRFQTPLYWNGLVDPKDQLFLLRTAADEFWIGGRPAQLADNVGVMLDGGVNQFHWWAAVQNGIDGTSDKVSFSGRARYNVIGDDIGLVEGAYGAKDDAALSVGVGYFNDKGAVDAGGNSVTGDCFAFDTQFTKGPLAANFELLHYSKDPVGLFDTPDSTPWALTASYMFVPNLWEAAARYQDVDTTTNLRDVTVGVNYYAGGRDAKWQLNVVRTISDASVEEATSVALGLTIGK